MSEVVSMNLTCSGAPVQYEGQLDDGRWFYFRSRGSACSLGIGDTPDDAVGDADQIDIGMLEWERDPYAFGYIPLEVATALIPWMLELRKEAK